MITHACILKIHISPYICLCLIILRLIEWIRVSPIHLSLSYHIKTNRMWVSIDIKYNKYIIVTMLYFISPTVIGASLLELVAIFRDKLESNINTMIDLPTSFPSSTEDFRQVRMLWSTRLRNEINNKWNIQKYLYTCATIKSKYLYYFAIDLEKGTTHG